MTLPSVMPANLVKFALQTEARYPGRMAVLFGPGGRADPRGLPYALDNGRFSVWSKGKDWQPGPFVELLDWAAGLAYPPRWVAVPDVVADAAATLRWWDRWVRAVEPYGFPLAMVVQDGMTPADVLGADRLPDVVFVGGSTTWKWRTLRRWTAGFPRVHVGRVNTERLLWCAHDAGAESSDGTGWYHHHQRRGLLRYLKRTQEGKPNTSSGFFKSW